MSENLQRMAELSPAERRTLLAQLFRRRSGRSKLHEVVDLTHQGGVTSVGVEDMDDWTPAAFRLKGPLNLPVLEKSLSSILQKHEDLKVALRLNEVRNDALARESSGLQGRFLNINEFIAQQDGTFRELDASESISRSTAEEPPLLEASCIRLTQDEYLLLFKLRDHQRFASEKMKALFSELPKVYSAHFYQNRTSSLNLHQERNGANGACIASKIPDKDVDFWKSNLERPLPSLALPFDSLQGRKKDHGFQPAQEFLALPKSLTQQLQNIASQWNISLSTLLLASYQTLLFRYSSQEDLFLGVANIRSSDDQTPSGFNLVKTTFPLHAKVTGNCSFKDLAVNIEQSCELSLEHLEAPMPEIVCHLRHVKCLQSSLPLKAFFGLYSGTFSPLELTQLIARSQDIDPQAAPSDLNLALLEGKEGLKGLVEYNSEMFESSTIGRLLGNFRILLEEIARNPQQLVEEYRILTAAERHQLLHEWNDTEVPYPSEATLPQLISVRAKEHPDRIAVSAEQESLTYGELNQKANQLAHHLQKHGVGPDSLVAVSMERSLELVVSLLGILKAGAAYVPVDPTYPVERIRLLLQDCAASVLLAQPQTRDRIREFGGKILCLDAGWSAISQDDPEEPVFSVKDKHLFCVIYTSGSTGKPKGVLNHHQGLCNRLLWMQDTFRLTAADTVLQKTPFTFDVSIWEFFWPLMAGARLVLARPGGHADNEYIRQVIVGEKITTLHFVPSMLQAFLQTADVENCRSLRRVICSGEALAPSLVRRFQSKLRAELHNLYGPTEASIDATWWSCRENVNRAVVPIGRPIANMQAYILDHRLNPVPIGVVGELHLAGIGLANGYLNEPDLTRQKFVPNPFSSDPQSRLYKTGDLARYHSDGSIEFVGRIDHQVKIRGFRIEPGEIEAALGNHPAISACVVTAHESGSGHRRLIAYYVPAEGANPRLRELRSHLQNLLPDYLIPSSFVKLNTLPLTSCGKVDRKALPVPAGIRPELEEEYANPSTNIEAHLSRIWQEVLAIKKVGVKDSFFELGGDSIHGIQMVARARAHGIHFTLQQLYHQKTIENLSKVALTDPRPASEGVPAPFSLIDPGDRARLPEDVEDAYPLASLQAGMLFHGEYQREAGCYHDIFSFRITAPFHAEFLQSALARLAQRHSILRCSFDLSQYSQPLQLIHRHTQIPLMIEDISRLSETMQEAELRQWMELEKSLVFDWSNAPLIRFHVHRRSDRSFQLSYGCHHAILDGWSMAVMMTELLNLYLEELGIQQQRLPSAPGIPYSKFIALERSSITSEECKNFWRQELSEHSVLVLPRWPGFKRSARKGDIQIHPVPLGSEISAGIKALAAKAGVSMKTILLAAHVKVLGLMSGQTDVLTGMVSHGRPEEEDSERVLGLFLNTLPFRIQLNGGSWMELIQQTFETEQRILPYRRFPLAEIQKLFGGGNLFETAMDFVHFHVYRSVLDSRHLDVVEENCFESTNFTFFPFFNLDAASGDLRLRIDYDAAEFSSEQMHAIGTYYLRALQCMVRNPQGRYELAPVLTREETRRMLVEWNQTAKAYSKNSSIHQLFQECVRRNPDAVAVVCDEASITYSELNRLANRLAHHLRRNGVKPDTFVGILASRSIEMFVGIFGILKAGGAYVPMDPSYPSDRLSHILEDTKASVLLTQKKLDGLVNPPAGTKIVFLDACSKEIESESSESPDWIGTPENLAYVIYTSGSTGKAKGVPISHRNLVHSTISRIEYYKDPVSSYLLLSSFAFDSSVAGIFWTLCTGGSLVVSGENFQENLLSLSRIIHQNRVSHLLCLPSLYSVILEQAGKEELASLKVVIVAGEACPADLIEQHEKRLPSARLFNEYGPTEGSVWCTVFDCGSKWIGDQVPIGRAIPNMQVYILDSHQQPVPVGTPGEIYIGGEGIARGYLNRPDLTRQKFIPDPFSSNPGARLYRTGDQGRFLPDGNIEFLGRIDHQVKIRGYRIEPGEIESLLLQHPAIKEAVVIPVDDAAGNKKLVAYYVPHAATPRISELKEHLRRRLPEYMVPSLMIALDKMPLTPNGKVDRKALLSRRDSEQPEQEQRILPRNDIEVAVATIWKDLLKLKEVGVFESFFELGGHSLLATRLASRLRTEFKVEIPLRTIFEGPSIARISEEIQKCISSNSGQMPATLEIKPVARSGEIPLSFAQRRLWFLAQWDPNTAVYNIPAAARIRGTLNLPALEKAYNEILKRHESLRTIYPAADGKPRQFIQEHQGVQIPVFDLSPLSSQVREKKAAELAFEEARKPFDLKSGPLIRATLLRFNSEQHDLLVVMHHITGDDWSLDVFFDELAELYTDLLEGKAAPLSALPIQYADFSHWQLQWLSGKNLEAQLGYWREQLKDIPAVMELPLDHPRPATQTFKGSRYAVKFDPQIVHKVQALCQQKDVTLYMALLASFQTLLHRYNNQEDIVVGSPVAGRNRQEIEKLIGFFVNTLVLRTRFNDNPDFDTVLRRVKETTLGALGHQDLPFEKLVEELQPQRSPSYSPIFQVMFSLQRDVNKRRKAGCLEIEPREIDRSTSMFDLTLTIVEENGSLDAIFEYNVDLFEHATIERMAGHYRTLLNGLLENPQRPVGEILLLTEAEKRRILVDWNNTSRPYPKHLCVHDLFEQQVERTPGAEALVAGSVRMTYAELNQAANRLAHRLVKLGAAPDQLIGVCMDRTHEMIVAMMAVLKSGAAYVPLDINYPKDRLAFMLQDAGAKILLTHQHLMPLLPEHQAQVICVDAEWDRLAAERSENASAKVQSGNLAYVIYTSGSTGKPKGVAIEHRNTVAFWDWSRSVFAPDEIKGVLASTSVCFDLSIFEIFVTLGSGGRIILSRDALQLPNLPASKEITLINTVPSAMAALLRMKAVPASVKVVNLAGEALPEALVRQIYSETSVEKVYNLYGPTEDTTYSTGALIGRESRGNPTIGRVISNSQLLILDRNLNPVPVGIPGEIYLGGDGLARGYLHRPELTAEKFVKIPFPQISGERLYRTGDLARWMPDGNVDYLGRIDFQVKIRGFRIELGEIESLLEQHPNVQRGVVIAREFKAGDKRLVAYLVPKAGELTVEEIQRHLRGKLPEYMVPGVMMFLKEMPLTPNGKVDRKALPEPNLELESADALAMPANQEEESLVKIWQEVLGLERVGVRTSFFSLGGHSLLATQLIARIEEQFQTTVSLRRLFETPTISGLAEAIRENRTAGRKLIIPAITPVSRKSELPLSFSQQRLWVIDQLNPGTSTYNLPAQIRFKGKLSLTILERTLREIVARHEVLRTTFANHGGQPVQVIHPQASIHLEKVDCSNLSTHEKERETTRLIQAECKKGFDLEKGPLLRFLVVKLASDEHALVVNLHHAIADGWSFKVFYRDFQAIYQALHESKMVNLPVLSVQYADYAHWQRQWLQGDVLERQLEYWKSHLAGKIPVLELPTDKPRPAIQSFHGATESFKFSRKASEALRELCRKEGVTPFMAFLAAFKILLHRYCSQDDILVGTAVSGRNRTEIENLIGFFVNTIVLRTDLSGNPGFRALLQRVKETTLQAHANQDVPFEKLVEELKPERSLSYSPIFQVMFTMVSDPVRTLQLPDLRTETGFLDNDSSKFDLDLAIVDEGAEFSATLEYNTDLYHPPTIQRMGRHLANILEEVVANPDLGISSLSLLTREEYRQIVFDWNSTEVPYSRNLCMHQLFESRAKQQPDAVAVVANHGHLTYREVNDAANQLAHHLRSLGIGLGSLVAVYMDRTLDVIPGLLAILKVGGAYVPLETSYPMGRVQWVLSNLEISCILTQRQHLGTFITNDQLPKLRHVICVDEKKERGIDLRNEFPAPHNRQVWACRDWKRQPKKNPNIPVTSNDRAYIIFTSGSTGTPKGVVVRHQPVINLIEWVNRTFSVNARDRVLFITSLCFDLSVYDIFGLLAAGGSIRIVSNEDLKEPRRLLEMLCTEAVTFWDSAPAALLQVVPFLDEAQAMAVNSKLRLVFLSGDWIPVKLPDQIRNVFRKAQVISLGGATEATVWSNWFPIQKAEPHWVSIPYGKPIQNSQYYVLDRFFNPCPVGVPGDLYIGGDCLASGYIQDEKLTSQKFILNPLNGTPGRVIYKTGDRARYWSDGNLEFLGRLDHQVKVRGYRIELGEIESVLREYSGVKESIVLAREVTKGNRSLIAYYQSECCASVTPAALRNHLAERLPEYMIPSFFVPVEAWPATPNGKIDRQALPMPDLASAESAASYVAPRNSDEESLAALWKELLGVSAIGVHDNFFERGGHSLVATQLLSRIRESFQVELPLRALFERPTIAGLLEKIDDIRKKKSGGKIEEQKRNRYDPG